MLAALFILTLVPIGAFYASVYPSPDQSLFNYLAWMNINGQAYYAHGFEQNWPGIMLLHELGIRLFGAQPWSSRLLDFVLMSGVSAFAAIYLHRSGRPLAAAAFALAYPLIYATSGEWMAGERDIVAMHCLLAATLAHLSASLDPVRRPSAPAWLSYGLAGALIAYAVAIRPTYLTFFALALILVARPALREARSWPVARARLLCLSFGFASVVSAMALSGLASGVLDDWYQQTILFNLGAYQVAESRLRLVGDLVRAVVTGWHWLALLAAASLSVIALSRTTVRELPFVAAMAATALISFFFQNKGFGYHLGGLIPLFVLVAALGLDAAARLGWGGSPSNGRRYRAAFLAMTGLFAVGAAARIEDMSSPLVAQDGRLAFAVDQNRDREAERAAVIAIIRCETAESDRVFQWGRLFDVLYRAERLPASRFVSTPALNILTGRFAVPWNAEFKADIDRHRPRMIVVDNELAPPVLWDRRRTHAIPADAAEALRFLAGRISSDYSVRYAGDAMTLLARRGPPARRCGA